MAVVFIDLLFLYFARSLAPLLVRRQTPLVPLLGYNSILSCFVTYSAPHQDLNLRLFLHDDHVLFHGHLLLTRSQRRYRGRDCP